MPHKRARDDLTAECVRSILDYDPLTGIFIWRWRDGIHLGTNRRCAGKPAGHVDADGRFVMIRISGRPYMAHRLAWLYMTGEWPKEEVDHKNVNPMDNRWENLREANHSQNNANRPRQPRNTSGVPGIDFYKRIGKWRVRVAQKSFGYYASFEDAVAARERGARELQGAFAHPDSLNTLAHKAS